MRAGSCQVGTGGWLGGLNIQRTNIRNNLTAYANNLASYLRANKPTATLDDVIGGQTIVPFFGSLREPTLAYQDTSYPTEDLSELPTNLKPTLRIQYQGIDQTYTSDAIYGKRLSITYNGSNQPVLMLDGAAVGSPGTAVATGTSTTVEESLWTYVERSYRRDHDSAEVNI